jgi:hypothetical protein
MSNWIDNLAASIILLVACVLFVLAWRRLAAIQSQLDNLSSAVNSLEQAHQGLLVRFMNLPKSRRSQNLSTSRRSHKSSNPAPNALEENRTAPAPSDEKNSGESALYVDAPKTFPD